VLALLVRVVLRTTLKNTLDLRALASVLVRTRTMITSVNVENVDPEAGCLQIILQLQLTRMFVITDIALILTMQSIKQCVKIVRQEKLPQQEQWDKMAVSLALVQVVAPTQPALQASVLEINVAQARVDGIPVAAQVVRATVAV